MRKSLIVYSSYILIVSLLCSIYLVFPNLYSFSLVLFFPSSKFFGNFFQNYFILRISGKLLLLPIYISIISFAPLLAFIYFAVFCYQLNFQIKRLKLKQNECCCSKLKLLHNTQKYDENKLFEFINFEWLREKEEVYVHVQQPLVIFCDFKTPIPTTTTTRVSIFITLLKRQHRQRQQQQKQ